MNCIFGAEIIETQIKGVYYCKECKKYFAESYLKGEYYSNNKGNINYGTKATKI